MKVDFNLYLITDRKQLNARCSELEAQRSLLSATRKALKGGVKAVQLREKDLETRELLRLAYKMRDLTRAYDARLFINDRFDVALAVGADGVHLTRDSIPVAAVRHAVKKRLMIGVSTHSLKEAQDADRGGADFITFGPVYRTPSKVRYGPPAGLANVRGVSRRVHIPLFALGGVRAGRLGKVLQAGASGAAMISEIFRAADIQKKSAELTAILNVDRRKNEKR
jgi:thiamine-phosphate pyrophosphorylase